MIMFLTIDSDLYDNAIMIVVLTIDSDLHDSAIMIMFLTFDSDLHYNAIMIVFLTIDIGGGGWCEGAVYLTSLGRPTDIGLQLGKACYPCSG